MFKFVWSKHVFQLVAFNIGMRLIYVYAVYCPATGVGLLANIFLQGYAALKMNTFHWSSLLPALACERTYWSNIIDACGHWQDLCLYEMLLWLLYFPKFCLNSIEIQVWRKVDEWFLVASTFLLHWSPDCKRLQLSGKDKNMFWSFSLQQNGLEHCGVLQTNQSETWQICSCPENSNIITVKFAWTLQIWPEGRVLF